MSEEERRIVRERLAEAVQELVKYMDSSLIPEVGTNIVYAVPKAREVQDVAGVAGRIVHLKGIVHPVGPIEFGASDHMARAVLTAMKFDPSVRSVANIRFSEEALGVMNGLMLEICEFDRVHEPPGIQTMDWGVAFCCKKGVPDAIFDRGAVGKEAMIRILGEDPRKVAQMIARISIRCQDRR
ncbi:MAG: phosphomethylpyrimidine kinase [Methanomicrobiales archaeon]|nr:phosphomethylpyrimidine kinase [Methanomicrobiales archaeon]